MHNTRNAHLHKTCVKIRENKTRRAFAFYWSFLIRSEEIINIYFFFLLFYRRRTYYWYRQITESFTHTHTPQYEPYKRCGFSGSWHFISERLFRIPNITSLDLHSNFGFRIERFYVFMFLSIYDFPVWLINGSEKNKTKKLIVFVFIFAVESRSRVYYHFAYVLTTGEQVKFPKWVLWASRNSRDRARWPITPAAEDPTAYPFRASPVLCTPENQHSLDYLIVYMHGTRMY